MKLGLYHAKPERLGCDGVHWPTATFVTANQPRPVLPSFHNAPRDRNRVAYRFEIERGDCQIGC